ncbi:TIGR04282 family arsenosugar biosynthesis glycosyltransferase [Pontibacter vulgaris]|uniref:TIGR04282 family arsenosugar biosynthesis glycosyltransferase n=1 Tax=Pontibacter vulgaris TaxID=2905679 RepID=UPI001FA6B3D8|nr:DUF2064 domain-containing protein [Pontibacter vulgaris]
MEASTSDIAILLFAHAPAEEIKYKSFVEEQERINFKIAKALLKQTARVAAASGLPVVTILSDQQQGNTFGERLANAFLAVFEAGYQRVICIGSDCPTLRVSNLQRANEELNEHNIVLGPATDGGVYLIGLHINSFEPESFSMLSWQSANVLQELTIYSYRLHSCMDCISLLQVKSDVDCSEDFKKALNRLPARSRLKRKLLTILLNEYTFRTFPKSILRPFEHYLQEVLLRAPPLFFLFELL